MGCWNATCGLSNLPIQHGDDILFFVLEDTGAKDILGGGFSYATDRYRPVGLPVHGTYNDYGGIENISKNGHRMFEFLTTDRRFKIKLKDETDSMPEDAEELLNDIIERGESQYSMMLVRKDILDGMKAQDVANYPHYARDFALFKSAHQERANQPKIEGNTLPDLFADREVQEKTRYQNMFANAAAGHEFPALKPFIKRAIASPHEDVQEGVSDGLYVTELLAQLRKFWTPQSGAGSQDNSHDAHLALCKSITAVCNERDREVWGN